MNTTDTTPKAIFQQTSILYLALLAGQVLFSLVVLWLLYSGSMNVGMEESVFVYLIPVFSISAIFGAYILQNRRNAAAAFLDDLDEKVQHYRQTIITCGAILEGANLLAIIAALLTGQMYYLLYFAIGLGAFVLLRPSIDKFKKMYRLSLQEAADMQ